MFDIWNEKKEIAELAYQQKNYKVKEFSGGGYCVIYCSSNGIWFPNEEYVFRELILEKDRYEWDRIKCNIAAKEIYTTMI